MTGPQPTPPPGWYADPTGSVRWWNGSEWTDVSRAPVQPEREGNPMAVIGLVLGVVGIALSAIAIGFIFGWAFGLAAVVLGAIARSKAQRGAPRKRMATWAIIVGVLSVGSGILGYMTIDRAVRDFNNSLDNTQQQIDATQECIDRATTAEEINACTDEGY